MVAAAWAALTRRSGALAATLREENALRVHRRLTTIARGLGDDRSIDCRRADVPVDLRLGPMTSRVGGVAMNVSVPFDVLLGLRDVLAEITESVPVPCEVARVPAAEARWRAGSQAWWGQAQSASTTYPPPAGGARLVRAQVPECPIPGCGRRSQGCDLDHAAPLPQGPTSAGNLGPLRRRPHVLKTHRGWEIDPEDVDWRTPAGALAHLGAA